MTQRRSPGRAPRQTRPGRARSAARRTAESRRSAVRSAVTRSATVRTVARRPRAITGRVTIVAVVLIALVMAFAYPTRVYLAQEAQIGKTKQAQEMQRRVITAETARLALWSDEQYVLAQARERFYWVRPGETPLIVWDSVADPAPGASPAPAPAADPWYDELWTSVERANGQ